VIERGLRLAAEHGAAVAAVEVKDTVKVVDEAGRVTATLERTALRAVQTPQCFRYSEILAAYDQTQGDYFDDAMLFEELGRVVVLGGVEVPHDQGLAGHSDADAAAHAVIDALLGAAALGDLGHHFPSGDIRWKDADSLDLMRAVRELLGDEGWQVNNVDVTVIAQ